MGPHLLSDTAAVCPVQYRSELLDNPGLCLPIFLFTLNVSRKSTCTAKRSRVCRKRVNSWPFSFQPRKKSQCPFHGISSPWPCMTRVHMTMYRKSYWETLPRSKHNINIYQCVMLWCSMIQWKMTTLKKKPIEHYISLAPCRTAAICAVQAPRIRMRLSVCWEKQRR